MSRIYTRSFATAFVSQTGFVMANLMMVHYALWIERLGGDVTDVGWIVGIGSLGALALRPWMGQWLNRLGARNMWALGYAFFLAGTLGNLLIQDIGPAIYVLRMCLMFGVACVSSSSLTYVSQLAPPNRQTEAIGILGVGGFIGFSLGPFLGDALLGSRVHADFVRLFCTTAGILVIPSILLLFLNSPKRDNPSSSIRLKDFVTTIARHWPGSILLVMAMFGVCMTVPLAFLAKYVKDVGVSMSYVSVIGLYFVCYAALGLSIRVGMRRVPDRFGRRKVLLAGAAVMSSGMFSFLLVNPAQPWLMMIPAILCGAGHGLMFHTGTSLVLESFPTEVRGTGSALAFMMFDIGFLAGAPVLGKIADNCGYEWMFVSVGCCCLSVSGVYALSALRRPKPVGSEPKVT